MPVYYVGTEQQGVFVSEDGGLTWDGFNNGLGRLNITKLKINDSYPRKLYAGTEYGGIWVTTIQKSTTSSPVIHKSDFTITVFPNPSDGTINIISNAESQLTGEIKVINLLGEVVYADKHFDVSIISAKVISLKGAAPGNYILMFTNDNVTINRKLIITRAQ